MNTFNLLHIVTGLFAVSVLFMVLGMLRVRHLNRNIEQLKIRNASLQNDFTAMCSAAVNMGNRIKTLDQDMKSLSEKQDSNEIREIVSRPYTEARGMLDSGVGLDDVVENCGVTHGEAELLASLRRHEKNNSHH